MKEFIYSLLLIVVLTACGGGKSRNVSSELASGNGSVESERLFSLLRARKEKGIMLGHRDALAYGSMWYGEAERCDMKSVCGDYPAVVEWDLGNIEISSTLNIDSVEFSKIKEYIRSVDKQKGISTLRWTVSNPAGNAMEVSVVPAILQENKYNTTYLDYLEMLSEFLSELKNEEGQPIPVVLNLFANPNLPDNWWSTTYCTPEEYKGLWTMTVDYLRNEKNIHHVLFAYSVYNPQDINSIITYYPGDNYVDIIGANNYLILKEDPTGKKYQEELNNNLSLITTFAEEKDKLAALMDTGLEGVKLSNYFSVMLYSVISQYDISYVMFGKNSWNVEGHYHIPIPGHPASEDFIQFVNTPHILTRNKLGNK